MHVRKRRKIQPKGKYFDLLGSEKTTTCPLKVELPPESEKSTHRIFRRLKAKAPTKRSCRGGKRTLSAVHELNAVHGERQMPRPRVPLHVLVQKAGIATQGLPIRRGSVGDFDHGAGVEGTPTASFSVVFTSYGFFLSGGRGGNLNVALLVC